MDAEPDPDKVPMPFPERNPVSKLYFAFTFQRLLGLYNIKILLEANRQFSKSY